MYATHGGDAKPISSASWLKSERRYTSPMSICWGLAALWLHSESSEQSELRPWDGRPSGDEPAISSGCVILSTRKSPIPSLSAAPSSSSESPSELSPSETAASVSANCCFLLRVRRPAPAALLVSRVSLWLCASGSLLRFFFGIFVPAPFLNRPITAGEGEDERTRSLSLGPMAADLAGASNSLSSLASICCDALPGSGVSAESMCPSSLSDVAACAGSLFDVKEACPADAAEVIAACSAFACARRACAFFRFSAMRRRCCSVSPRPAGATGAARG